MLLEEADLAPGGVDQRLTDGEHRLQPIDQYRLAMRDWDRNAKPPKIPDVKGLEGAPNGVNFALLLYRIGPEHVIQPPSVSSRSSSDSSSALRQIGGRKLRRD